MQNESPTEVQDSNDTAMSSPDNSNNMAASKTVDGSQISFQGNQSSTSLTSSSQSPQLSVKSDEKVSAFKSINVNYFKDCLSETTNMNLRT